MKRREFIKGCAAAGAMILLPNQAEAGDGVALTSIAHPYNPPKNCRELQRFMEALYSDVKTTNRGYIDEMWIPADGRGVCRIVPISSLFHAKNEAAACAAAWAGVSAVLLHYTDGRDTLLWRVAPYMDRWGPGNADAVLRMRFSVIPYDLREDHPFSPGARLPGVRAEGGRIHG